MWYKFAAQGYVDIKPLSFELARFLYDGYSKAYIKCLKNQKINEKKAIQTLQREMENISQEGTNKLKSLFPGYLTPNILEMFSAGFSNNPELSSFGAYYQPSFDHHIIIVRFFKNQGGGMSFEPSSFNTFLSDIEHELTHFSQAKELLFKTDSDGNLLHDRETFKTKLDSYLKANKDRAKEFKIKDVDEALDLVAKMEGLNLSPSMRSSLRPDIEKMILNDEPSLWDRNDPREPSAHIQDILRQLKPPTENDLSSSENFMSYVNKSEAFKTYMLSVKDVRVKKSLLKSLYYAVNLKKDDPTAFKISEKDEDTLFPEVAKAYEDLYKKPEPMKSMQPMKAKKKK